MILAIKLNYHHWCELITRNCGDVMPYIKVGLQIHKWHAHLTPSHEKD